ncbi:MAG: sterol carrier protein domain-containing protein, partial [Planctomycetaceae bacterium]|nr:sterol carrier protein domain-containing protein [Planctomycetaceae bacterium]
ANALAPVYAGYASPREVRTWGSLEGPDDALDALAGAFAGPAPWKREMY